MATVNEMLVLLRKLKFKQIMQNSVQKFTPEILDAIREQHLAGEHGRGKMAEVSPGYAEWKKKVKPDYSAYGLADLELTGDFHDGLRGELKDDGIYLDSSDSKSTMLESEFGTEIFLLNDRNMKYVSEYIVDEALRQTRIALGI